jgi:hypothetical protein
MFNTLCCHQHCTGLLHLLLLLFLVLQHAAAGSRLLLFDIPLLYETQAQQGLDAVVVVSAPAELQRQRVMARPGMTAEKLDAILARQVGFFGGGVLSLGYVEDMLQFVVVCRCLLGLSVCSWAGWTCCTSHYVASLLVCVAAVAAVADRCLQVPPACRLR